MTKIILDTNIWICLTKVVFNPLWLRFKKMAEAGEIEVIVNDIILLEWERNKENTLKSLSESIKNEYRSAVKISIYLEEGPRKKFLNIVSEYKDEKLRIGKAKNKVIEIENFMKSRTIIESTKDQKLFISRLAINNLPPFHGRKNVFNDALIVRNIYDYGVANLPWKYDLIYVSNNPRDFIDEKTGEIYHDLIDGLNPIKMLCVKELGEVLKLSPYLIDDFESWLNNELEKQAENQSDFFRGK